MICPEELVALITSLAIALSKGLTIEQIDIFASALTQLGDTLATIAVQKSNIQACYNEENVNIIRKEKEPII